VTVGIAIGISRVHGDSGDGDRTADTAKASATAIISFFMCVLRPRKLARFIRAAFGVHLRNSPSRRRRSNAEARSCFVHARIGKTGATAIGAGRPRVSQFKNYARKLGL
jgi:hypothetical protein